MIGRVAQGPLVISTLVSLGWDTWLALACGLTCLNYKGMSDIGLWC